MEDHWNTELFLKRVEGKQIGSLHHDIPSKIIIDCDTGGDDA